MDGLFLSFLCRELNAALVGARVERVIQPERDELLLTLHTHSGTKRLLLSASANCARIQLTEDNKPAPMEAPMFSMLLRKHLRNARIRCIVQIGGDRILEIAFDALSELGDPVTRTLVVEIMGRHSNIILLDGDRRILDAIRHVGADISRVREVRPGLPYTEPPGQEKINPQTASAQDFAAALASGSARLDKALCETLMGLGQASGRELAHRLTGDASPHMDETARAGLGQALYTLWLTLPMLSPPVLRLTEADIPAEPFPFPQRHIDPSLQLAVPEGPSAALTLLYRAKDRVERMDQKAASLKKTLESHIERCERRLAIHRDALHDEVKMDAARTAGELIMGNLYLLYKGQTQAALNDYATGEPVLIALDVKLSPQDNAKAYFKRYQKLRDGRKHAATQAALAEEELSALLQHQDDLRKAEDATQLTELRTLFIQSGHVRHTHSRTKQRKMAPSQPMMFTSTDGIGIRVGRNSAQNERLTFGAPPESLWLHAKNMAGSHVIIDATGDIPENTVREAAMLAAYYSRGVHSAQVAVDYTQRKYVKKPAGGVAGFVVYTHQRTVFVTPDEGVVARLKR